MPEQTVAIVTLGCARNEVDSEELAGRLHAGGWRIVDDPQDADAVLVNTCGFVDVAKKDSIDALLAAADLKGDGGPQAVVAVGCLSERYGRELADELPEADAVLGFDDYPEIADRLRRIVGGERPMAHAPSDRRLLLPIAPVDRPAAVIEPRVRLTRGPVASVKIATGCDRRCAFCAIPTFRGSFASRDPQEILAEIAGLAADGVREVVLVSENSTSYGKDLGDLRLLERLLPSIAAGTDIARLRVAYLQPAEVRPGLLEVIATTDGVAPYFDLSFQHASATVLRRMRRFGGLDAFLDLIARIRGLAPDAGIRTNVIVGFPGETEEEFAELLQFIAEARLDAVGVFGYSDEDGTEALGLPDKVAESVIRARVEQVSSLVDEVMCQRAEERIGSVVEVLVEEIEDGTAVGRAAHQGPDDGTTSITGVDALSVDGLSVDALSVDGLSVGGRGVGELVVATVIDVDGVDLIAERR